MSIEEDFFSYKSWDKGGNDYGDIQFYDCIFKKDIDQNLKKDMKADVVYISFSEAIMIVYIKEKKYEYKLSLTLKPIK